MTRSSTCVAILFVLAVGATACKRKEAPPPPAVDNTAAVVPAAQVTPVAAVAATEPLKVQPAALTPPVAAKPAAPTYASGAKIKINWKGSTYPGVITQVVGPDKYKIHYDGYGNEWDEVIGPSRIVGRR